MKHSIREYKGDVCELEFSLKIFFFKKNNDDDDYVKILRHLV